MPEEQSQRALAGRATFLASTWVEGTPARSKEGGGRGTEVQIDMRGVEAKTKWASIEEGRCREEGGFFFFEEMRKKGRKRGEK